ncbi:hypothetical protein K493DRAFT_312120 [Basidiobolus meristosporus CBS 931.73]|uniref:Uncharacterized protein n=1 Tax=Basidiobolus meristosporus CBS 931.73 TaxID=1314790 RepID=A0A1Y1YVY4_9FUNG|nr:hypothetical protein K493DRAFT_312120 [Basidiobolus meristosporus CBS 931.73]|eukprot:ORY02212.1 hypothetical protein K493DRAFT_312120 [Basidiobolus meristosporus CBS 931.73]
MQGLLDVEVVVIGNDIDSLILVEELLNLGIRCRAFAITPSAEIFPQLILHARTLEILDQMNLLSFFTEASVTSTGMKFCTSPTGQVTMISLEGIQNITKHPYLLSVDSAEVRNRFEEYLKNVRNFRIEDICGIMEVSNDDGVKLTLEVTPGAIEEVKAKYLVLCTSTQEIFRKIDVEVAFSQDSKRSYWGAKAAMNLDIQDSHEPTVIWSNEGSLSIVRVANENEYLLLLDMDDIPQKEMTSEEFQQLANRYSMPYRLDFDSTHWVQRFPDIEYKNPCYVKGSILFCGKATYSQNPMESSQDLNRGIQDVQNLAWKLNLLLRGFGKDSLILETYAQERSPRIEILPNITNRAFSLLLNNTRSTFRPLRNLLFPWVTSVTSGRAKLIETMSETNLIYGNNRLVRRTAGSFFSSFYCTVPGMMIPNFELQSQITQEKVSLYSMLGETFQTFIRLSKVDFISSTEQSGRMRRFNDYLKQTNCIFLRLRTIPPIIGLNVILPTLATELTTGDALINYVQGNIFVDLENSFLNITGFQEEQSFIILIRPDGYVGLATTLDNFLDVESYFAELSRP